MVRVTRGPETESLHAAHGVVVGLDRWEEVQFGEPDRLAYWRSSMKPFQALPLVAEGAAAAFDFDEADLALVCGSHHGTAAHVSRARAMLGRIGREEEVLACGAHAPFDEEAAASLLRRGATAGRIHNNCSGKHIGMLALALHRGWPVEGYGSFGHPVQARIRGELSRWLDVDPEGLTWATDGCGVPTPYLSLRQMARAYARLVRAAAEAASVPEAVVRAMTRHPDLVSGPNAFSCRLMQETGGRLLAKEGAEGVFCVASTERGWGLAVKVLDGGKRAAPPAVMEMLSALELAGPREIEALAEFRRPVLRNSQGREVGRIVADVEPHRATVAGRV